ncbi:MAG: 50S ribosomal protein L29 [Hadesarchaea archaeon]|nr:50S ribosomal protein L29 [Hadesarchaea archaeon]
MAVLKPNEIRDMSIEEMQAELDELRSELARERAIAASGGALENPGRVKELRKGIARVLTIMKEVQREEEGGA